MKMAVFFDAVWAGLGTGDETRISDGRHMLIFRDILFYST